MPAMPRHLAQPRNSKHEPKKSGMTDLIPPATAAKLAEFHPVGTRHKAAMDITIPLVGNGLSPNAIFAILKDKFPEVSSDKELWGVINWAIEQNPTPTGYGNNLKPYTPQRYAPQEKPKPKDPIEQAKWWLNGLETNPDDFCKTSPFKIPETPREMANLFFELLYSDDEFINVVCKFTEIDNRACPQGAGRSLSPQGWIKWIRENGVPDLAAGAWVRPNPVKAEGSGANGAYKDEDVTAFRFLLLESDTLPLSQQLALYQKLKLPISAVYMSGGKSAHALARVNAKDEEEYKTRAQRILAALSPFGIDLANKNPSRLSRLPGAVRKIGAAGDGLQRLLYINPKDTPFTDKDLEHFENSLLLPVIDESPFRKVILDSVIRYEELYENRGKLGVPTGFVDFDRDTGGLKGGQMTVVAAETNGGKSTFAINIVNNAISKGFGVALFTLEMDREEIADLIISMNCQIDRNCFNTGYFSDSDLDKMSKDGLKLSRLPLWIFDDATITADQISKRVSQLKSEKKISLVVIDYIQLISPFDPRESREQQVAGIARAIRVSAKESKLPFIILSQLNDEGKLRESRVVAHEAHNVILLETDTDTMTVKVVKGRRIMKKNYELRYNPRFCQLKSPPRVEETDMPYSD